MRFAFSSRGSEAKDREAKNFPERTQEQEVLAQLVLAKSGRVALEMLGELADITDVLLFGGSAKIFKLDVLSELGDRRIVNYHRPGRMPVSAGNFPAKLNMQPRLPSPRRVAAQFNHAPQRIPRWRDSEAAARSGRRWHADAFGSPSLNFLR